MRHSIAGAAGPLICAALVSLALADRHGEPPPRVLPAMATAELAKSLEQSQAHRAHVWRDTAPLNGDGTVNAYVEISRGDRRKWEFDMHSNARAIDRVLPGALGGYPVNYGFVPQTVSYDGDPFDALVLGPPLPGGQIVRGVVVGLLFMEDEKGIDSKVVLSPIVPAGGPRPRLTTDRKQEIAGFFKRYKEHEPRAFSRVPGWGTVEDGLALVTATHAFFRRCAPRAGSTCELPEVPGPPHP